MPIWDPTRYLQYADQRGRPFFELVDRVAVSAPRSVVDLGCGPGEQTATLTRRWPNASVLGIDSSAEMINVAQQYAGQQLRFSVGDLRDVDPAAVAGEMGLDDNGVDVIISNATLQWVDDHRSVLPGLVDGLNPGGWLAVQVPGNQNEPSHTLLHRLGQDPRFAEFCADIDRRVMPPAQTYLADLSALGCTVDAWETSYLHVLTGDDAVFTWVSGTGARPYLQALPADLRTDFVAEYKALLRESYPQHDYGTVLPFRRIFAVAHKPE